MTSIASLILGFLLGFPVNMAMFIWRERRRRQP